jgi:hypothetical protein
MADVEQIRADITALQDAEAAASGELQTLADQVAALRQAGASNITDADLEQLHENIQAVTSGLVAATQQAQESANPAPPSPPEDV